MSRRQPLVSTGFESEGTKFEIFDSIRTGDDDDLIEVCKNIMEGIKGIWNINYVTSRVDISNYNLVYIDTPKQDTMLVLYAYTLSFFHSSFCFFFAFILFFLFV